MPWRSVRPHSMRGGACNPHRLPLSMLDQTPYRTKRPRQFAPAEHCHQSKAMPACRHLLSATYLRCARWPQCYLRQSSGDDRAHHRRHGKGAPGPQHRCCLRRRRSSGDDHEKHRRHGKGAPGPQHRCCLRRRRSSHDREKHRRHGKGAPGPQHRSCQRRRRSSGDDREKHRRHGKGAPGPQHRCCQRRQRSSGDDRATHRRLERAQRLQLHRLQFHRPKTVQTMKLKHPQGRRRRPRRDGRPHPCLT
mgnify:CR=1 FL=1